MNYSLQQSPSKPIKGKCLVYVDDNFDGRIKYSNLQQRKWDSVSCHSACSRAMISDCHYSSDDICKYRLTVLEMNIGTGPSNYDCVITNTGRIDALLSNWWVVAN